MKSTKKKLKAVILVGGLGTRLRPIIGEFPKPMVEIGGKPFLERLLCFLKKQCIKDIIFCVGYKNEIIKDFFKDGSKWDIKISYAIEEELLGTGGAIKNAAKYISNCDTILILNGDSFINFDLDQFLDFHIQKKSAFSILVTKSKEKGRFANILLDKNSKLTLYKEKEEIQNKNNFISAGIYLIDKKILNFIPNNKVFSLEYDLMPDLMSQNIDIYGYKSKNELIDIGTPQSLDYFKKNHSKFFKT